jgi:hypothetical protein
METAKWAVPEMKRLKLRAAVHQARGTIENPRPALVEIEQNDGGYYLFCLDEAGQYLAHTWHETLDDAKAQAHLKLAVQDADWAPVNR